MLYNSSESSILHFFISVRVFACLVLGFSGVGEVQEPAHQLHALLYLAVVVQQIHVERVLGLAVEWLSGLE